MICLRSQLKVCGAWIHTQVFLPEILILPSHLNSLAWYTSLDWQPPTSSTWEILFCCLQYSFWRVSCQYIIFPLLTIYHFSLLLLGFAVLLSCPRCGLVFIYFETELLSCIDFEKVLAIMYWILLSPFFLLEFVVDIYWAMSLYSLHFFPLLTYSVFMCCILGKFWALYSRFLILLLSVPDLLFPQCSEFFISVSISF